MNFPKSAEAAGSGAGGSASEAFTDATVSGAPAPASAADQAGAGTSALVAGVNMRGGCSLEFDARLSRLARPERLDVRVRTRSATSSNTSSSSPNAYVGVAAESVNVTSSLGVSARALMLPTLAPVSSCH